MYAANVAAREALIRNLVTKWGADIEARDGKGRTALILAAMTGISSSIEELHDLGASLEARDFDGMNAWKWAKSNGRHVQAKLLVGYAHEKGPNRQKSKCAMA